MATLDLRSYPGGRKFAAAFKRRYGTANPDPYSIYGYEAMKLVLHTLAGLGAQATDRAAVVKALLATKDRHSALGTYSFDADGDISLHRYGVYKVDRRGDPVYAGSVDPG